PRPPRALSSNAHSALDGCLVLGAVGRLNDEVKTSSPLVDVRRARLSTRPLAVTELDRGLLRRDAGDTALPPVHDPDGDAPALDPDANARCAPVELECRRCAGRGLVFG